MTSAFARLVAPARLLVVAVLFAAWAAELATAQTSPSQSAEEGRCVVSSILASETGGARVTSFITTSGDACSASSAAAAASSSSASTPTIIPIGPLTRSLNPSATYTLLNSTATSASSSSMATLSQMSSAASSASGASASAQATGAGSSSNAAASMASAGLWVVLTSSAVSLAVPLALAALS
ncbi:unnamed protein product [Parajaminaea phylloscopi]